MAPLLGAMLFALVFLVFPGRAFMNRIKALPLSKAVYAEGGELLGASVASDGQWRLASSAEPPERFVKALTSYEDRRFYGHAGLDTIAVARAILSNLKSGSVKSGASTITMQLARLSKSAAPRTIAVKMQELWLAARLELSLNKADILKLYAGLAPFGANVAGLEAAGFRWFGRAPEKLSWAEAACLAVLPNSPGLVHPGRSRDELKHKRDALLHYLADKSYLQKPDLEAALAEKLPATPIAMPNLAPHYLDFSEQGITKTRLDAGIQERAIAIVKRHSQNLYYKGIENMAAVILRVGDSSVAAYIGNSSYYTEGMSPWVDCAAAPRSSGSILKPFLYASMLDSGELIPSRLIPDIPTRIGSYSPENNLKNYSGAVRADEALAKSLNVPFVRLLRSYGVERFVSLLKKLGFKHLFRAAEDYGLPLILGGAEVSLLEAAHAYAALARAAKPGGDTNYSISGGAAWLCLEALVDVARPAEEASWQEYASSRRIAWKTGTSFGSRDAWAIGVSTDWVVAVWAGNASGTGRPELKGSSAAAPLMFDLFELLPKSEWFPLDPKSVRYKNVCSNSGYAAGPYCREQSRVLVPAAAKIDNACPYCTAVRLSKERNLRVRPGQYPEEETTIENLFILPPAIEFYYAASQPAYKALPPWADGSSDRDEMEFIMPEENSWLYIPVELDGSLGKTVFCAVHRQKDARLFWHLDGHYMGETRLDHRMEARPGPGRRELIIVDEYGNSQKRVFYVYEKE